MVNVGKYTSPMDAMGGGVPGRILWQFCENMAFLGWFKVHVSFSIVGKVTSKSGINMSF